MKNKIKITVMCDYNAKGIWKNDLYSNIMELPKNTHYLKKRLKEWQEIFESFQLYKLEGLELEIFYSSNYFKNFIQEGENIAIKLRSLLNKNKYIVEYFNEKTLERNILN